MGIVRAGPPEQFGTLVPRTTTWIYGADQPSVIFLVVHISRLGERCESGEPAARCLTSGMAKQAHSHRMGLVSNFHRWRDPFRYLVYTPHSSYRKLRLNVESVRFWKLNQCCCLYVVLSRCISPLGGVLSRSGCSAAGGRECRCPTGPKGRTSDIRQLRGQVSLQGPVHRGRKKLV